MPRPFLALRISYAFAQIVRHPNRLDVVFDLVDGLSDSTNLEEYSALFAEPQVAAAARRRLRVCDLAVENLAAEPMGSLGETAARFFREHDLDPAALPRREAADDLEWLGAHLYETHDLWHVLTGFGPDVAGELGLQAFYAAQVEGPVALAILAAGMLNTIIYAPDTRRERLAAIARGWDMGISARSLVGVDWSEMLSLPLSEVRSKFGLKVAPERDAMSALPAVLSAMAA